MRMPIDVSRYKLRIIPKENIIMNIKKMILSAMSGILIMAIVGGTVSGFDTISIMGTNTTNLIGTPTSTLSGPNAGGSSGGGGGGGGGTSGENFSNIEIKEKHDLYIYKDKVTSYVFSDSSNPVQFINITGNSSPGEINAAVEVLKNTSSLVKTPAPGMVYRNVNIWVGTSGFAVPKNIKYAVIRFKVENSWISISGLSSSDIKMLSWDGREWLQLETAEKTSDSKYTYYEVNTDHFSSFAISGIKGVRTASPVVSLPSSPEGIAAVTPAAKASGFEFFFAIIAIFSICRRKRR